MSDSRGKDSSFLRKVAKFVSSPNTEWGGFEEGAGSPSSGGGAQERSELQIMVERKRRNDFVRRQELDLLRQVRRQGLTGELLNALQNEQRLEGSSYQPTEQGALPASELRNRIDGIERDMAYEDTIAQTRTLQLDLPSTSGEKKRTVRTLKTTSPIELGGTGTTPIQAPSLQAQEHFPKIDLHFDPTPPPSSTMRLPPQARSIEHDPVLDEAAIAFANADFAGSERALRSLLSRGGAREGHLLTWQALLDLYRAMGQRQRFDATAAAYVKAFGETAPTWVSIPRLTMKMHAGPGSGAPQEVSPRAPNADSAHGSGSAMAGQFASVWRCPLQMNSASVQVMREHVLQTAGESVIDWTPLKALDRQGADALRLLLREWSGKPAKMGWEGISALFTVLDQAAAPGDHLADPAFWLVRLEAIRLLGAVGPFRSAAEDYAATYGTAAPEWSSAVTAIVTSGDTPLELNAMPPVFGVSTMASDLSQNSTATVELVGQLAGDISATMGQALTQIKDATTVLVSCSRLIHLDLMAAGELLNWVSSRRSEGRTVRFTEVHRMVALFLCAMGLDDQATIELRPL